MNTIIIKSENGYLSAESLKQIYSSYKLGIPVVLPSETVYGLSAPYNNVVSIKNIFKIKNRPADNPLIVHISSFGQIKDLSTECIGVKTMDLLKSIWPGPLTILLKKSKNVDSIVTAESDYVAVRMPNSIEFRQVIEFSGAPLVAPSANLSGKPSPTNATDALEDLNNKVKFIVDGGEADIGLESTVIRIEEELDKVIILRPGKVNKDTLSLFFTNVVTNHNFLENGKMLLSPGMKYKHYAPKAKVWIIEDLSSLVIENESDFVLSCSSIESKGPNFYFFENEDELAKNLFKLFRKADRESVKNIFVAKPNYNLALLNRLQKASELI